MLHITRWPLSVRCRLASPKSATRAAFRIALLVLVVLPLPSLAQDTGLQPRPSAALPSLLKVGDDVKVFDQAGRTIRGRVTSITGTQFVVVARRAFWRQEERTLTIESVRTDWKHSHRKWPRS